MHPSLSRLLIKTMGYLPWCLYRLGMMAMQKEMEDKRLVVQTVQDMEDSRKKKNRKRGGMKTMPFILANEICDRLATVGFYANMITYLTLQLNMPLVQASNTLTNFGGTASFTPLVGALIADSYAGQFWTITVGSLFYVLGLISITLSAILPSLHPPPCPTQVNCKEASSSQLWVLYISLLLTSLGTGGIRPCVMPFAASQLDTTKSSFAPSRGKWNFFNWYYFSMCVATLVAITAIVYVQDNVGWGWGLGIPTIIMALSIIAFVVGAPLYRKLKPAGSPMVRLVQVIVAAVKKRKAVLPDDSGRLYQNHELDAGIATDGRLLHSKQFRCLDKAAVLTEDDQEIGTSKRRPNLWKLATVHRVEELKSMLRILPIWSTSILLVTASSHQHSFVLQQARTMNRHITSTFQIPPASLSIFSILTVLFGLVLYERCFIPVMRKFTGKPSGITCLQRMGIGLAINIFATIAASLLEVKRKSAAAEHNLLDKPMAVIPISVFWLIPQYVIHGLAEVFMNVGHMEFLYDQSPESMRSTATGLYCITTGIGNFLGTFLVSLVHKYTGGGEKDDGNWLPDRNLNKGRLEYYYLLVSGIQAVNFVYFAICAWLYTYKSLEQVMVKEDDGDAEGETDEYGFRVLELGRRRHDEMA